MAVKNIKQKSCANAVTTLTKGKLSKTCYFYLVPKEKWPKRILTHRLFGFGPTIFVDRDPATGVELGYEFLDCYGIEIGGKRP